MPVVATNATSYAHLPSGTLHGGEEIKPGTLHGGEEIKPGTLHFLINALFKRHFSKVLHLNNAFSC